MRKSFALLGTSAVVSSLVGPVVQTKAAEANTKAQTVPTTNPFLNSIIPAASKIADNNNLYASVMMAQAILESGWGQSELAKAPNHNLFGIKGDYEGETVEMTTLEDSGNQNYYQIQAEFRKYPSYSESLEDYAQLLRNGTNWDPMFYSGAWKSNASTYQDATQFLTGRYATDTAYATKLNKIIETNGLAVYDTPSIIVETKPTENNTSVPSSNYQVKVGDTLYSIANKHGISVVQLMEWNQLNSSTIHPGTSLKVNAIVNNKPTENVEKPSTPIVNPSTSVTYTVKSGDSLWKISQMHNVTVAQIKSWNGLKSDVISPGQTLKVSNGVTPTKPVENTNISKPETNLSTYTVKHGDTLFQIANKLGLSVAELKALNQLKADIIYPGQQLVSQVAHEKPETPAAKPQEQKPSSNYQVQRGDSLYKISSQFGMSIAELKSLNKLDSDIIYPGQKLITKNGTITQPEVENTAKPPVVAPVQNESSANYTVKSGDTLYSIATKLGISVSQIKDINQLRTDIIYPGQVLVTKKVVVVNEKPVQNNVVNPNYMVKSGDTLYKIATSAGVTIAQLKDWNNLNSDIIFVGQALVMKANTQVQVKEKITQPTGYTVKSGDTLYSIARNNGITVTQLLEWNATTSDTIYPGQNLRVK